MNIKLVIEEAINNHKKEKSNTELFCRAMDNLTQRMNISADICLQRIRLQQNSVLGNDNNG